MARPRLLLALACAACMPTPRSLQKDYARSLTPAELAGPEAPPAKMRPPLRLRIYVDRDYRAVPNWQRLIDKQIDGCNEVLGARFGTQFTVVERRDWNSRAAAGDTRALLEELEQLDPGRDVDWVVGFATALPVFTSSLHELGVARVLGKHLVVRGMDDRAELDHFARLTALTQTEQMEVYYKRRRHKEVVALLHEWGHTFGAVHAVASVDFMYPRHSAEQALFSGINAEIVDLGLDHLTTRRDSPYAWLTALGELLAREDPEIDGGAREDLAHHVAELLAGHERSAAVPGSLPASHAARAPEEKAGAVSQGALAPAEVTLVTTRDAVQGCRQIGFYRAKAHIRGGTVAATRRAEQELKSIAAQRHANRILVETRVDAVAVQLSGDLFACAH